MNLQNRLKEIEHAEEKEQKRKDRLNSRLCDWNDEEDVLIYRRNKRREKREEILQLHLVDRKCPRCKQVITHSRNAVVIKKDQDIQSVTCRSCHFKTLDPNRDVLDKSLLEDLLTGKAVRYTISRRVFLEICVWTSVSSREIARRCGWGQGKQRQLEDGSVKTMTLEQLDAFVGFLESLVE